MSIADTAPPSHPHRLERTARVAGLFAVLLGTAAAWFYARAGLTLSHYDAKAHLVVARRVIDGLTPGWAQIGAVWLPLPHVLNALPAQWDWSYRTGAAGVVLSVVPMAVGLGALAGYLSQRTSSYAVVLPHPRPRGGSHPALRPRAVSRYRNHVHRNPARRN